jgi:hypothetical protein
MQPDQIFDVFASTVSYLLYTLPVFVEKAWNAQEFHSLLVPFDVFLCHFTEDVCQALVLIAGNRSCYAQFLFRQP